MGKAVKLVIFDLDGTLLDTGMIFMQDLVRQSLNRVCRSTCEAEMQCHRFPEHLHQSDVMLMQKA